MKSPREAGVIERQRPWAVGMVVIEAITFGLLSAKGAFPDGTLYPTAVVFAAAVAAVWRPFAMPSRRRRPIVFLLIAVVFLVAWRVVDHSRENDFLPNPALASLLHVAGQALLAVQVGMLLVRRPVGGLPPAFVWSGVLVFASAGDVQATAAQSVAFQTASIVFTGAAIGLFHAGRTGSPRPARGFRPLPAVVTVLFAGAAIGLTLGAAAALRNYTRSIDRMVSELLFDLQRGGGRVGFSRDPGRLGSTHDLKVEPGSTAAAVRVEGFAEPTYLRGRAFVVFTETSTGGFQWDESMIASDGGRNRDVSLEGPLDGEPTGEPGLYRYESLAADEKSTSEATVRLIDPSLWEDYFLPARTVGLVSPASNLIAGPGAVRAAGETAEEYRVERLDRPRAGVPAFMEPDFSTMAEDEAAALAWGRGLTSVPLFLENDARFSALADEVFAGCETVPEHVAAVEKHFVLNHGYSLSVTVPSGRSALEWFLFDQPDAYCEYFATGAAVLLRSRGIATRYVTGFVAAEWNFAGQFFTARNGDAHAWAEAYDPERGWLLVEATASAGVPQRSDTPVGTTFWDAMNDALVRFRAGFRRGGVAWLAAAIFANAGTPLGILVIGGIATYLGVRSYQTWWRRGVFVDPVVARLERARSRADRAVARAGVVRRDSEPPTTFARRLRREHTADGWADWYVDYAAARYDPRRDAATVDELAGRLARIAPVKVERDAEVPR